MIAAACGHGWLPGVEEGDNGEDALVGVQGGVDFGLARHQGHRSNPLPVPDGTVIGGKTFPEPHRRRNASVSSLASLSGAGTSSALARNATDINFCDAVAPIVRPAPFVRNR